MSTNDSDVTRSHRAGHPVQLCPMRPESSAVNLNDSQDTDNSDSATGPGTGRRTVCEMCGTGPGAEATFCVNSHLVTAWKSAISLTLRSALGGRVRAPFYSCAQLWPGPPRGGWGEGPRDPTWMAIPCGATPKRGSLPRALSELLCTSKPNNQSSTEQGS